MADHPVRPTGWGTGNTIRSQPACTSGLQPTALVRNQSVRLSLALGSVLVLLLTSCSGDSGEGSSGTVEYPPALRTVMEESDGLAAEIFEDGIVTPAEMESAAFDLERCFEEAGLVVTDFSYDAGTLNYTISGGSSEETVTQAEQAEESCRQETYEPVSSVFGYLGVLEYQNSPEFAELEAAFLECLRRGGVDVDSITEAREATSSNPSLYTSCLDDIDTEE